MHANDSAALRRLATLIDEDGARTDRVGIPVSYGHYLVWLAVIGTFKAWQDEWVHLARTKSVQAATEWSAGIETQVHRLIKLVYPGGSVARPKTAQDIREMADAAEAAMEAQKAA